MLMRGEWVSGGKGGSAILFSPLLSVRLYFFTVHHLSNSNDYSDAARDYYPKKVEEINRCVL